RHGPASRIVKPPLRFFLAQTSADSWMRDLAATLRRYRGETVFEQAAQAIAFREERGRAIQSRRNLARMSSRPGPAQTLKARSCAISHAVSTSPPVPAT